MSAAVQVNLVPTVAEAKRVSASRDRPVAQRFVALSQVLGAVLAGSAIAMYEGTMHWQGIQWLAMGMACLFGGLILCQTHAAARVSSGLVHCVLGICVAWQLTHMALIGLASGPSCVPILCLRACLLVMTIGLMIALSGRLKLLGCGLLIGGFAVAGFAAIWTRPHMPRMMDVVHFQHHSSAALLAGKSPYEVRYRNVYHPNLTGYGPGVTTPDGWLTYSFPYPPTTLMLVVPGYMAGDVRYAHLAALTLAAGLIILAGRGSAIAILGAGLLLSSPRAAYVVHQGWTEPLLVMLASFVLFAALRWRGGLWIAVGLLVSVKQYLVLVGPLLLMLRGNVKSWGQWWLQMTAAGVLCVATMLPFVLWSPLEFYRGVVEWQFVQPYRNDSLSIANLWAISNDQTTVSGLGGFVAAGVALLLSLWKSPRNVGGFMASAAVVFVGFFAFNKQAFCNYYFFVIGLACCAVVGLCHQPSFAQSPTQKAQRAARGRLSAEGA
ncbi:MAG TPA: hypothetical protein PLD59_13025 [Tepidisphaeraceae bacterium]|nr:hypothetical protein [Tepidisphaeraceae bacterium]